MRGGYDPRPWLSFGCELPFTHLETLQKTASGRHEFIANGLGDLALSARMNLVQALQDRKSAPARESGEEQPKSPGPAEPVQVLLGLKLAVPTGFSALYYEDSSTGKRVYFPPEAQLGSGTWRPGLSITAYRRFGFLFPMGIASYTYGRMLNRSKYLLSDVLNLGLGTLAVIAPKIDLRASVMLLATFNVHDIRYRDKNTGAFKTVPDSHGWLFFLTVDGSVRLWDGLAIETGVLVPLGKTLEESPNDLDFLVRGGIRFRF